MPFTIQFTYKENQQAADQIYSLEFEDNQENGVKDVLNLIAQVINTTHMDMDDNIAEVDETKTVAEEGIRICQSYIDKNNTPAQLQAFFHELKPTITTNQDRQTTSTSDERGHTKRKRRSIFPRGLLTRRSKQTTSSAQESGHYTSLLEDSSDNPLHKLQNANITGRQQEQVALKKLEYTYYALLSEIPEQHRSTREYEAITREYTNRFQSSAAHTTPISNIQSISALNRVLQQNIVTLVNYLPDDSNRARTLIERLTQIAECNNPSEDLNIEFSDIPNIPKPDLNEFTAPARGQRAPVESEEPSNIPQELPDATPVVDGDGDEDKGENKDKEEEVDDIARLLRMIQDNPIEEEEEEEKERVVPSDTPTSPTDGTPIQPVAPSSFPPPTVSVVQNTTEESRIEQEEQEEKESPRAVGGTDIPPIETTPAQPVAPSSFPPPTVSVVQEAENKQEERVATNDTPAPPTGEIPIPSVIPSDLSPLTVSVAQNTTEESRTEQEEQEEKKPKSSKKLRISLFKSNKHSPVHTDTKEAKGNTTSKQLRSGISSVATTPQETDWMSLFYAGSNTLTAPITYAPVQSAPQTLPYAASTSQYQMQSTAPQPNDLMSQFFGGNSATTIAYAPQIGGQTGGYTNYYTPTPSHIAQVTVNPDSVECQQPWIGSDHDTWLQQCVGMLNQENQTQLVKHIHQECQTKGITNVVHGLLAHHAKTNTDARYQQIFQEFSNLVQSQAIQH